MNIEEYIMDDFCSLVENKIKKDFNNHTLFFNNRDFETKKYFTLFGSFLINNGVNVVKEFDVNFIVPEQDDELKKAINAILRIKSTYEHRNTLNAKFSVSKDKKIFHFENAYNDSNSEFYINIDIPIFLIERICLKSYKEYYHLKNLEEAMNEPIFRCYNSRNAVIRTNGVFKKSGRMIANLYGIDYRNTFFDFHIVCSDKIGYYEDDELLDKIMNIKSNPSLITVKKNFRTFKKYAEFDLITIFKYGDYYLVDCYDTKMAREYVTFHDDFKDSKIASVSNNIGLEGDFQVQKDVVETLMHLHGKNGNPNMIANYLNLLPFNIYNYTIEYQYFLKNLYIENDKLITNLFDLKASILKNPSEEGRKNLTKRLAVKYNEYYISINEKMANLNKNILHHIRNALSHYFIENLDDKITLYDKGKNIYSRDFTIEGYLEDYKNLDNTLAGENNYGKDTYTEGIFFLHLKRYLKDYFMFFEGMDEEDAKEASKVLVCNTLYSLNDISKYVIESEIINDSLLDSVLNIEGNKLIRKKD